MVSGNQIPTELWDEAIGFLSPEEDRETLQHVNLINRRFHHLARPRLFADFEFYPYSVVNDSYGMIAEALILPLYFERFRKRLEFWASEDIAPLVRNCTVQPLEFEELERPRPPGDPYSLLNSFYEFLPRFVNLELFAAFTLHFTGTAMANLRLLTKLRALSVDMCTTVEGETLDTASKLKLHTFRFANCDNLEEWWLRAICPDTLRNLGLDLSGMHYQGYFHDLQPHVPCFPNVQVLDIAVGRPMASCHVNALAKFPGVKDLALIKWRQMPGLAVDFSELSDTQYCPLLERYFGPVAVLPFLPVPTLTNMTVEPCEPVDFLAKMHAVQSKHTSVRYLRVTLMGYLTSLRDLTDIFPNVTILRTTIEGRPWISTAPEDDPQKASEIALVVHIASSHPRAGSLILRKPTLISAPANCEISD
ncbi:hypothetical protein K438DRAFT_185193 [Mycena galopus ATCC 62051]|nr:hypothetical protein K438DRAFT_185193 [Mycena galopus ATCC 62051]